MASKRCALSRRLAIGQTHKCVKVHWSLMQRFAQTYSTPAGKSTRQSFQWKEVAAKFNHLKVLRSAKTWMNETLHTHIWNAGVMWPLFRHNASKVCHQNKGRTFCDIYCLKLYVDECHRSSDTAGMKQLSSSQFSSCCWFLAQSFLFRSESSHPQNGLDFQNSKRHFIFYYPAAFKLNWHSQRSKSFCEPFCRLYRWMWL